MADAFSDALYFSYGKTSGLRLPGTTRLGVPPSLARSERFELPGFSTLERMARAARVLINRKLYAQITKGISDESKIFLDTLFDTTLAPDNATSQWAFLKQEMQSPTTKNVNAFIQRLKQLQEWRARAPATINDIPAHRLDQFIEEATALDSSDMKSLKQDKRYALAATMLQYC